MKDKIVKKLNGIVYWESGWSTYAEIKDYYNKIKDLQVGISPYDTLSFSAFRGFLLGEGVRKGSVVINGKSKRVWKNIAPINSDRG